MKRIVLLGLVAAAGVLLASAPAMADGYHRHGGGGFRASFYGGYGPYYGAYRPYYGPAYYPPPQVYYYPPYASYPAYPSYQSYPAYPPPVVGGYYRGPGFSFSFGR